MNKRPSSLVRPAALALLLAPKLSGCAWLKDNFMRHSPHDWTEQTAFTEGAVCGQSAFDHLAPQMEGFHEGVEGALFIDINDEDIDWKSLEAELYYKPIETLHLNAFSDLPENIEAYGVDEKGGLWTLGDNKMLNAGGYACSDGTIVYGDQNMESLVTGKCDLETQKCNGDIWIFCPFQGEIDRSTLLKECDHVAAITHGWATLSTYGGDSWDTGGGCDTGAPEYGLTPEGVLISLKPDLP